MRKITLVTLLISNLAHAQWGVGVNLGNNCPSDYGPSRGSQSTNDMILNLQGKVSELSRDLQTQKSRLSSINKMIKQDRKAMEGVLTSKGSNAIEEHYSYARTSGEYQADCSAEAAASVGTSELNISAMQTRDGANASGTSNSGTYSVPNGWCYKSGDKIVNTWKYYALDGGEIDPAICQDYIPGIHKSRNPSSSKVSACRDGLQHLDEDIADRNQVQQEIEAMESELDSARRDIEREQYELSRRGGDDTVSEGTYCASCAREGYSKGDKVWDFVKSIAPVVIMGAVQNAQNKRQDRLQRDMMERTTELGWPMFPGMGGGGGGFGSNRGWAANPSVGMLAGYMGTYGGQYGGVPSMMGSGAFNCAGNGSNPMAMNQMAPGMLPYPGPGGSGAFGNPYLQNPYMNGMNPGGGPWGMNGGNGTDPFSALNPNMFQPYYGMNPAMLPYMNGGNGLGGNGQNGWYDQYPYGGANGAPPYLPYPGPGYPYGGNGGNGYPGGYPGYPGYPYGGGGNGYPGGYPGYPGYGGGGYPGYGGGGGGGYGGGGLGGILGSLSYDLYAMNIKVRTLQYSMGGYSMGGGGSGSGGAPIFLPYPGPSYPTSPTPVPYNNNPNGSPAFPGAPSVPSR